MDETTETDSDNYVEFNRTKIREDQILGTFKTNLKIGSRDIKLLLYL